MLWDLLHILGPTMDRSRRLEILRKEGVVGTYTDEHGELVVQYDSHKTTHSTVKSLYSEPYLVEDVPGGFVAQGRRDKVRPLQPGVSVGAKDVTAGTHGIFVEKDGKGPYIDTNLHVAGGQEIKKGEPEFQPGPHDQQDEEEVEFEIGYLDWYVNPKPGVNRLGRLFQLLLNLRRRNNERARYYVQKNDVLRHDVGLIEIREDIDIEPTVFSTNGAYPTTIEAAPLGETCKKFGRTTGETKLKKKGSDWTGTVLEPWGPTTFVDQNIYKGIAGPGSKGGDSGSTIMWDSYGKVDGRLFAGSREKNMTIGNPYPHFAEEYNISIYSGE